MRPRFHCLEVASRSLALFAGVNDVPVFADPSADGLRAVRSINEWILPEGNEFTVFAGWPPGIGWEPGRAQLTASVFVAAPGATTPRPGRTLAELRWPPAGDEGYPLVHRVPFEVDAPPPTRLWRDAQAVGELTPQDEGAILGLVDGLRAAVTRGDVDAAMRLVEYKTADEALANGQDPIRLDRALRAQYSMAAASGPLVADPIRPESAVYVPVVGGRVRLVQATPLAPAITLTGPNTRFAIDVYVARVGGTWRIVR